MQYVNKHKQQRQQHLVREASKKSYNQVWTKQQSTQLTKDLIAGYRQLPMDDQEPYIAEVQRAHDLRKVRKGIANDIVQDRPAEVEHKEQYSLGSFECKVPRRPICVSNTYGRFAADEHNRGVGRENDG